MRVIKRHADGQPTSVELTAAELLVKEIYDHLLDVGMSPAQAIDGITGRNVHGPLRTPSPVLDSILADEAFYAWLED